VHCLVVELLTEIKTTDQTTFATHPPVAETNPSLSASARAKNFRLFKFTPQKNCVHSSHQGATVRSPIRDSNSFIAALTSRGYEMFQATDDLYALSAEPIVSRHGSSKGLGV
jgi:hypothetical protein